MINIGLLWCHTTWFNPWQFLAIEIGKWGVCLLCPKSIAFLYLITCGTFDWIKRYLCNWEIGTSDQPGILTWTISKVGVLKFKGLRQKDLPQAV